MLVMFQASTGGVEIVGLRVCGPVGLRNNGSVLVGATWKVRET